MQVVVFTPCESMLQETVWVCNRKRALRPSSRFTQPAALGKSSAPTRGISATLRQVFLDSEIKHIAAETATVNQLPQSGIHPRKINSCSSLILRMIAAWAQSSSLIETQHQACALVICKLAAPSTPPDNLDYIATNNKPNDGSVRWGLTLSKGMPCQQSGFKSTVVARTSFS